MAEIDIDHVTKRYPDGFEAVKDADFTIDDGEFFILVGPSGCGKSTLLRMIVGLEDISEGTLRIGGDVVNERAPKDRNCAMVFQNYAIYPHMTVRENMAFPLKIAKMPQAEIDRRVNETAEILELEEHLDRKPAQLSGGQRQRVAMGRAIVREPAAFLMDEPLSNLDAKLRVQMRTEISRLQDRLSTTTVYVTHDQTEAMTLGDRIAVMRRGLVQQVGTPRELYENPANLFVAGFIGSPAMNFLPAEVQGDQVKLPVGSSPIPAAVSDRIRGGARHLIVGVRPEHIEDASLVSGGTGQNGFTFRAKVDVVEWMGSELFAYFRIHTAVDQMTELASDLEMRDQPSTVSDQVVARLDPMSKAREGEEIELWVDARRLKFFDPQSGENLGFVADLAAGDGGGGGGGPAMGARRAGP